MVLTISGSGVKFFAVLYHTIVFCWIKRRSRVDTGEKVVKLADGDRYSIEAVLRALDVLDVFRGSEALSLAEISQRVGLNKSRVFRLLHTLSQRGYVERGADGADYVLGIKLVERAACVKRDLRQLALPFMRQLHERFNETVNLGILDEHEILYLEMLESSRPIRMAEVIGSRSSVHSTALGKAIVASLPEAELLSVLEPLHLVRKTERTITDKGELRRELMKVRREGYAVDNRENDSEGFCIGAPIFDGTGRVIAAMSVSGPADRVQGRSREIAEDLKRLCRDMTRKLSFSGHTALANQVRIR